MTDRLSTLRLWTVVAVGLTLLGPSRTLLSQQASTHAVAAIAPEDLRSVVLDGWISKCRAMPHLFVASRFPGPDPGELVHCDCAIDARGAICLDSGHSSAGVPWRAFYGRTQTWMDAQRVHVNWVAKRMIESIDNPGLPNFERLAVLFWFRGSGVWTLPDNEPNLEPPAFFGSSVSIRHVLRDARYKVAPMRSDDPIDAARVSVSRQGIDEIVLGAPPDFPLLRRTWYQAERPAMILSVRELRDVAGVGKLPAVFDVTPLIDGDGNAYGGAHPAVITVEVVNIDVQKVARDVPLPEQGPGWLRLDRKTGTSEQVVPGGHDMLEESAGMLQSAFERRVARAQDPAWWRLVASVCALLAAFVLLLDGHRRRARRTGEVRPGGSSAMVGRRASTDLYEEKLG
ncbi:MAG: hypothetical protein MUC36_04340 [Planctomycetes bacterium]|jgi:hypothetical protein|nr:hypothetical protein [Planctomycetota bacterium]